MLCMGAILNQRQYRITKSWIRRFEAQLQAFLASDEAKALHPKQRQLEEEALRGQLETLRTEVKDFESVRT